MLKYKEEDILHNNNKFPINVLSFKLPDTEKDFYTPLYDSVFRSIFGTAGNEHITKAFLESILKTDLENFSLNANPEFLKKHVKDKKQTTDVKAICVNSKTKILIEMQARASEDVNNRFTTYGEKTHLEDLKNTLGYTELPRVIMVIIMADNLPALEGKENYFSVFNDREKDYPECLFSDGVTKYVIELPKYIKLKKETTPDELKNIINPWLEFLINPLGQEVNEYMRSMEELREAVDKLRDLNEDDEVREIYEAEFWDRCIRNSERSFAEKKGRSEGLSQGRREGRNEGKTETETMIILNMIKNNISIEDISKLTNIDIERVKEIIDSHKLETVNA